MSILQQLLYLKIFMWMTFFMVQIHSKRPKQYDKTPMDFFNMVKCT